MATDMVIAGGGIGGLAAALACGRSGHRVHLIEQAAQFGEVGAGIQLGPNVGRVLESWGLTDALNAVAATPQALQVRSATSAQVLATLPLGETMVQRYGAAYRTIARADLHGILLQAVQSLPDITLQLGTAVTPVNQDPGGVTLRTPLGQFLRTPLLIGADGVWSRIRSSVVQDGKPRVTGHLAYRAMVPQASLPAALRSDVVTAWMGPRFHAVQYPVHRGEWLNVVVIVQGQVYGDPSHWDLSANPDELRRRISGAARPLMELVDAIPAWRLWALSDRAPMQSAAEHAKGRIALLGDAAHPMRPYLAQGAGMAIEDAAALAQSLAQSTDIPAALQQYAQVRWQRNARVQARAVRNGEIFHLDGLLAAGRNAALRLLGAKLLDVPWLYRGMPD
ncbi:MAG: FAD-dependent monooxygenase [Rhodoferax sp.]|nr:FAD-dependent monooxygenase [Rhodoferax sp.]